MDFYNFISFNILLYTSSMIIYFFILLSNHYNFLKIPLAIRKKVLYSM